MILNMNIKRLVLGPQGPYMYRAARMAEQSGIPVVQATVAGVPVTLENCRMAESPEPESGDLWLLCQTADWQELPDCPAFLRMAYNRAQDAIVSVFLFPSESDARWEEAVNLKDTEA